MYQISCQDKYSMIQNHKSLICLSATIAYFLANIAYKKYDIYNPSMGRGFSLE